MKPAEIKKRAHSLYVSNPGPYKAAWYKWEFLRRNPDYQADYQGFLDSFGAWFKRRGCWYDQARRASWKRADQNYFNIRIEPHIIRLCQKWQIFDLFPPDKGIAEARESTESFGRELFPPTGFPPDSMQDFRSAGRSSDPGFVGKTVSARHNGSLLSVEFNLNWRIKDLVQYAERVIGFAQENYRDELGSGGLKFPKGRRRFEDYDIHLRVWDYMRQFNDVAKVAALVFPGEGKSSAHRKVREHLKAAGKLINGHFKEIR